MRRFGWDMFILSGDAGGGFMDEGGACEYGDRRGGSGEDCSGTLVGIGGSSIVGGGVGGGLNAPVIRFGMTKPGSSAGGMFILPRLVRVCTENSVCTGSGDGTMKGEGEAGAEGVTVNPVFLSC